MNEREDWVYLLNERCFAELAYFAAAAASSSGSAEAHLLAGIGCCGLVAPLANAQRVLDQDPVEPKDKRLGGLRVSPTTRMPFAGLEHLLTAFHVRPTLTIDDELHDVVDRVGDDLAYTSRRELRMVRPPRSHSLTCVMAAVLLRRVTGSGRPLPRISSVDIAEEAITEELSAR